MQITISDPQFQTVLFTIALLSLIVLFVRKVDFSQGIFPADLTTELKGFAILTIIFGHIGYFLDTQDTFLYPLSIVSGVGVNIFLFLSGYGLTVSILKKPLSILSFYYKRLLRLFIPMWLVLGLLLLFDWLILGITYPQKSMVQNFFGFFPVADIYSSVNSVLWYFSFILFFYLIFPLVTFSKKVLLFSPLLIYLALTFVLNQELPINKDVLNLYTLHTWSFPLGMFAALIPSYLQYLPRGEKIITSFSDFIKKMSIYFMIPLLVISAWIFGHTALYSHIGEGVRVEQFVSLITTFAAIFFFMIKRFRSKFLTLIGIYSYEIYLIHWPLVYRYDFLFPYIPPFLAMILYMFIMIGIGWGLQRVSEGISKKFRI